MEITVLRPTKIRATAIRITFPVDEEDLENIPADFPGMGPVKTIPKRHRYDDERKEATIIMVLDLDTRSVRDWPKGRTGDLYVKVRDSGKYELLDGDTVIATRDNTVPACIPEEYGDYLAMTINADGQVFTHPEAGQIRPWVPNADDITEAFFPEED
jgi:hypothetical protein